MEDDGMDNRRRFLIRGVSLAAVGSAASYIGYRVAAHNGWIHVTRNSRVYLKGDEPAAEIEAGAVNLLVVGDTGKATPQRSQVVAAMQTHLTRHRCDATLLLGDNFYESGVTSVDDPRFSEDFEELFDERYFPMPFYVALGNHDCGGSTSAQVEYSVRSNRWMMPAHYYQQTIRQGEISAQLFVLDTNLLLDEHQGAKQLRWLRDALAASDATWKLVVGHHPILTGGRHSVEPPVVRLLQPILDDSEVDFYLSGHDHDLQLLDSGRGWRQIVSGAGCKLRSTSWIDQTVFARASPGYVSMTLTGKQAYVSYFSPVSRLITVNYAPSSTNGKIRA